MNFNEIFRRRIGSLIIDMEVDSLEMAKNAQRPRYIKSHLPIFLLPDKLWTIKPQVKLLRKKIHFKFNRLLISR